MFDHNHATSYCCKTILNNVLNKTFIKLETRITISTRSVQIVINQYTRHNKLTVICFNSLTEIKCIWKNQKFVRDETITMVVGRHVLVLLNLKLLVLHCKGNPPNCHIEINHMKHSSTYLKPWYTYRL